MIGSKKVIAIALARGGSKGIPGKNIKDLAGKPLIAWVILAAKNSKYIDRVLLSTDYEDIAAVGRTFGAETPFMRPKELAEDLTPDTPVFEHAIAWLKEHEAYEPDIVVHLRPTGPMVTSKDLDTAIELLEQHPDADSVRSVKEPPKPPFKMWKILDTYMVPFATVPGLKDAHTAPRQLLPKVYQTTPDVGIFRLTTLLEKKSIIGDNVLPYIIPHQSVDIDVPIDFVLADIVMREQLSKEN